MLSSAEPIVDHHVGSVMGKCVYCGEPAGFLRGKHSECEKKHADALEKIPIFFARLEQSDLSSKRFHELIDGVATASHVGEDELRRIAIEGIGKLIDDCLTNATMTDDLDIRVGQLCEVF